MLKVYGSMSAGAGLGGFFGIVDSAGNYYHSVANFSTTGQWLSTTSNMPATLAQYWPVFRRNSASPGASFTVRAFSLFQYEA